MHSPDISQDNIAKIRALFPDCVTEAADDQGTVRLAVDFDQLRQQLSDHIVEGPQERYRLDWPGKREALLTANAPIAKTLRPAREESVDFDTTQNLFIEGDNLDALKLLQESYLGKVKLIYIDPPYNTGNDFIYEDDFAESTAEFLKRSNQADDNGGRLVANSDSNGRFHSDWLTMMYARLRLARNVLADDGLIFVSLDDVEASNARVVMDEIFGSNNFIAIIAWEKRYTRSNNAKRFYSLKDSIIVYRKSEILDSIKEPRNEKSDSNYSNLDQDSRGSWMTSSYVNPARKEDRPNLVYPIVRPKTGQPVQHPTHAWKYSINEHRRHVEEGRLWWGKDGLAEFPRLKLFLSEQDQGLVPVDLWDYKSSGTSDEGGQICKDLFGTTVFDNPKPVRLIQRILGIATKAQANDVVLDFFAGSATTAHAVMAQNAVDGGNRRYILVQLPEDTDPNSEATRAGFRNIADISEERIRRAGAKVLEGECHEGWNRDVGFRVLKVDSSNMTDVYYRPDEVKQDELFGQVDSVKPDRTAEDLLFQVLIDWGVELTLPINRETLHGKSVYSVDGNALIACFETGVTDDLVKDIAARAPLRAVFRDTSFARDADRINAEQLFRQLSPGTELKAI